jgi:competence protein ComEA
MLFRKMNVTLMVVLCFGLVIGPVLLPAQQASSETVSVEKVNLNTATAEQLESLPGIGPSSAKNILEYRNKVGKFTRIEEVINIKGIGEKKFLKIKNRLTI